MMYARVIIRVTLGSHGTQMLNLKFEIAIQLWYWTISPDFFFLILAPDMLSISNMLKTIIPYQSEPESCLLEQQFRLQ